VQSIPAERGREPGCVLATVRTERAHVSQKRTSGGRRLPDLGIGRNMAGWIGSGAPPQCYHPFPSAKRKLLIR
jgi:hypothetical protein